LLCLAFFLLLNGFARIISLFSYQPFNQRLFLLSLLFLLFSFGFSFRLGHNILLDLQRFRLSLFRLLIRSLWFCLRLSASWLFCFFGGWIVDRLVVGESVCTCTFNWPFIIDSRWYVLNKITVVFYLRRICLKNC
jgi:hypothetical protein